jgi:hypothetical protein
MIEFEKYFPILANINILAIHLLWKYFNVDIRPFVAPFFGFSLLPWILLYWHSKRQYFCLWHRILLINVMIHGSLYTVNSIINSAGYEMLPIFYVTLRLTELSLIVAVILYFKDGCFKTDAKSLIQDGKRVKMRGVRENERSGAKHTTPSND